jgi:hypothetical protein
VEEKLPETVSAASAGAAGTCRFCRNEEAEEAVAASAAATGTVILAGNPADARALAEAEPAVAVRVARLTAAVAVVPAVAGPGVKNPSKKPAVQTVAAVPA